jgi:electron transfer flavoprotein alpha subunit
VSVLCLVEHDSEAAVDASLRAVTFARDLAAACGAPVLTVSVGKVSGEITEALSAFGVTDAYQLEADGLSAYAPSAWARALSQLVTTLPASAVIAAGTDRGQEVMANLGAMAGLAMIANCMTVSRREDGTLAVSRQRWAGSLIEDAVVEAETPILTVAVDAVLPVEADEATPTKVHTYRPDLPEEDLRVSVLSWTDRSGGISLADARVVVGGGRGVGSADGFAPLEELAGLLGAAVGVSRVVTSLGWRSHSQQVGQTGTKIAPDLYLACGISGAIQHLAGCQSAKCVVAINTDPDAPIMSRADYAVIGDLNVVVPALVEHLRARAK